MEPTILNLISYAEGTNQLDDTFKAMLETLTAQGYKRVPVNDLISLENQRQTDYGKLFMQSIAQGKVINAEEIVRFLRKVIYSGDGHEKYILTEDFPSTIEQVREFEKSCATISAVIYSGTRREGDGSFNIPNSQLRVFENKALFLKEFRLNTLSQWDESNWQEIFDDVKIDWCLITGQPMSGKSQTAATLRKTLGASRVTVFELKDMEDKIKPTLGTPEEPFEGKVPQAKIEEFIVNTIKKDKQDGKRLTYAFDGFPGQSKAEDFSKFTREKLRCPADFIVQCQVASDSNALQGRYKKKLEAEGDLSEEQVE